MSIDKSVEQNKIIQQERVVNSFLNNKKVKKQFLNYDNFKQYADAKHFVTWHYTNNKDKKQLNKFIRHWIITKGDIKTSWLTKINKMVKYYTQKEQNYKNKLRRVTLRPNSIKQ